jgi:hypothetical protein
LAEVRPKPSREILNLKKIQDTLAKQKEYIEAQKVKSKVDQLVSVHGQCWGEFRSGVLPDGCLFRTRKQSQTLDAVIEFAAKPARWFFEVALKNEEWDQNLWRASVAKDLRGSPK